MDFRFKMQETKAAFCGCCPAGCCNSQQNSFQVAIIPYTHDNTNFCQIEKGTVVNLEFDIVGKYISKMMQFK